MSETGTALTSRSEAAAEILSDADFEQVVRRHQRRVHRFLLMTLRDPEEADNLTQDCFLRAYLNRTSFRGEASVETWLLRIAANLVRDRARNRKAGFWKRLLGLDGDGEDGLPTRIVSPHPSPEQRLLAEEEVEAVWEIVGQLSEQQRAVFTLRFVEEMELKEIAKILELRVGSVKSHLFRAVQALRSRLGEAE